MCGIFGGNLNINKFRELASFNIKRGNLGFGGLSIASNQEMIFRYNQPFSDGLNIPEGDFLMGHVLASTGNAKRIHPFESDRFILAHNGILLNHQDFNHWYTGPVDSQYLLGGIQSNFNDGLDVIQSIKITNEVMTGQRACWLWDRFKNIAYFWRVMSPLFYTLNPFVFSSSKFEDSVIMEEGVIYSYDYSRNLFATCTKFIFYSPYLV